jgi:hypothetical protein
MKFNYAAGIPGYGTPGTDGSTGMTGLATYFSSYDGNTDTVTLKSRIINNKVFFPSNTALPNGRSYQNGDIFIDKNGKVFVIDFTQSNLYADTGSFLNTSGYFSSLKNSPTYAFNRVSNLYLVNPALVDVVYSSAVGDYTTYPSTIYNIATADFAQVKYVDKIIAGKYPFTTWTIGSATNDNAISLVREQNANKWHLGNSDVSIQKTVTLVLDFSDVSIAGNLNVDGSILAGSIDVGNGTVTSPSISFKSNSSTGFYWATTSQIRVATSGIENFRFDVSTFHAKGNLVSFSAVFSDRKIKTNITPLKNSLDKLIQLNGIEYDDTRGRGHQ